MLIPCKCLGQLKSKFAKTSSAGCQKRAGVTYSLTAHGASLRTHAVLELLSHKALARHAQTASGMQTAGHLCEYALAVYRQRRKREGPHWQHSKSFAWLTWIRCLGAVARSPATAFRTQQTRAEQGCVCLMNRRPCSGSFRGGRTPLKIRSTRKRLQLDGCAQCFWTGSGLSNPITCPIT